MAQSRILYKRLEIQKTMEKLKREAKRLDNEWQCLVQKCEHEIIITTCNVEKSDGLINSYRCQQSFCLLCDVHLSPRIYLPRREEKKRKKAVNIKFQDYPRLSEIWGKREYRVNLEKIYCEVSQEFPNLTGEKIGRIMLRRLDAIEAFI